MSNDPKRKTHKHRHREETDTSFASIIKNAITGSLTAILASAILALILSAVCMVFKDPSSIITPIGLLILYFSSAIGGAASAYKLRSDKTASIAAGCLCGLTVFVIFGICSTALDLVLSNTQSFFGLGWSLVLRAVSILSSFLGAYIISTKRSKSRHKRK